jgi:hypothetical protein
MDGMDIDGSQTRGSLAEGWKHTQRAVTDDTRACCEDNMLHTNNGLCKQRHGLLDS